LTAIKGWAETLNGIDDPETVQKGMRVITNESERLAGMVDELLDFSRIQNGRFVLNKEHIDILAELGEAVLIYRDRTRREEIELIYNEPAILPVVFGDKNRIRQVFINIIDNAIKYTDKGGTITIDAYAQNDEIVIVIADTGCGIPAADLPKIKTKFFKANYSQRGSGIGLAVAEEIITMHSGKIFVDSIEGEGTTITITIPAEQRAETAKPAVEAISTPQQEAAPQEQDRTSEMEE
ncbi:MAG TPA: HAMP domain-containing sensor histidine kinase, partial [Oscillospiraceae bacterium]|nr:HAMP domain-containing sensor histidine kinase [Oscillospiraceae bacterium]